MSIYHDHTELPTQPRVPEQPYAPVSVSPHVHPVAVPRARSTRRVALVLALVSLLAPLAAWTVIFASTTVPTAGFVAIVVLLLVGTGAALVGLVLGAASASTAQGVVAIVLSVLGGFASFGSLVVVVLATAIAST